MTFDFFSPTQLKALSWWSDASPYRDLDAVICDGAVRSGKTLCMGTSFVCWAMRRFDGQSFGICGKAKSSIRRNMIEPLLPVLRDIGFAVRDLVSKGIVEISYLGRENRFYLFGGKDESSGSLIQGVTLAGALLDEVVLMPRSFVEQACARCSVTGSKIWFNCNPESPQHWFYREWIRQADRRRALYIHFTLEDNPSLSKKIIDRYKRMYSGDFYRRFILGQWVLPEGRVYDFFSEDMLCDAPESCCEYIVSCDYGTKNPSSFGLWGRCGQTWYRLREYYYDGGKQAGRKPMRSTSRRSQSFAAKPFRTESSSIPRPQALSRRSHERAFASRRRKTMSYAAYGSRPRCSKADASASAAAATTRCASFISIAGMSAPERKRR